jgi:mediator of RNA polymerase II transcription subunit 7
MLEEIGRKQIYNNNNSRENCVPVYSLFFSDPAEELKMLNAKLLKTFLELIDLLITNNDEYKGKIDEINLIAVNMHHLLNSYRPHQGRQTLISMMEQQLLRTKTLIEKIKRGIIEAESIVDEAKLDLKKASSQVEMSVDSFEAPNKKIKAE